MDACVLPLPMIEAAIEFCLVSQVYPRERDTRVLDCLCPGCGEPLHVMIFPNSPIIVPLIAGVNVMGCQPFHWCRGAVPDGQTFWGVLKAMVKWRANPTTRPPHWELIVHALTAILEPVQTPIQTSARNSVMAEVLGQYHYLGDDGNFETGLDVGL